MIVEDTSAPSPEATAQTKQWQRASWCLAVVVGVAALLRMTVLVGGPAQDISRACFADSGRYIQLGENLAKTGTFGLSDKQISGLVHIPLEQLRQDRGERETPNAYGLHPEIVRTPGYPMLIGAVRAVNAPLIAVLLVQCVCGVLNVLLVYGLAARVLRSKVGALIAAAIVAIHPALIACDNALLSESPFITCLLAGTWLSMLALDRGTKTAACGGALLGLSVLIRPISIVVGPAIAIWIMITQRKFRIAMLLMACSLIPVGGWIARNVNHGSGIVISTIPNINAWFYTAAHMDIARQGGDLLHDWPAEVKRQHERLRAETRPDETAIAAMKRLAVEEIKQDPRTYVSLLGHSAGKFATDHSASTMYHLFGAEYQPTGLRAKLLSGDVGAIRGHDAGLVATAGSWVAWNSLLAVLTLAGLVRLVIARRWATLALLAGLLVYFVFATQTNGLERFRLPIIGFQAITVAAAFIRLKTSRTVAESDATEPIAVIGQTRPAMSRAA